MKKSNKYHLVLASNSPRRKELLNWLNIPFSVITAQCQEEDYSSNPIHLVKKNAEKKGKEVLQCLMEEDKLANPLVVSADTIVVTKKMILGKPRTKKHAQEMLQLLSGKQHQVYTAVCLLTVEKKILFCCKTDVEFSDISPELMKNYLSTNESRDKAGGYGIQGAALTFISRIKGSYSNVVGFPLAEFVVRLKKIVGVASSRDRLSDFFYG